MAVYNENIGNRILEVLNFPLLDRCSELNILFERCNLRELQEVFPAIVQSVFGISTGGLGWGLRATTKENSQQCFDMLHNFFSSLGPMLRLCYRLLNEAIKFELPLEQLPHKLVELLQSGQYNIFYADLINVDPFRRQITSLSLNAFDYYMLHFVTHATFPLHKMYPAALQVHNERSKTVYLFLTAEYLCNFLPSRPDAVVMPTNICASVKAPQPMPVQQLQPKKLPKYLRIPQSNNSLYGNNISQINQRNADASPRAHAWRTESVLYFFIDTWLRYDVDEARDLPSSEFIRVVRILVKQTHSFANCASLDHTAMASLRKIAQPMMKPRIYQFFKSIIARWPLDSSLSVVLELWLSYIQPWRYRFEYMNNSTPNMDGPMNSTFDCFIADNLIIYTQIFLQILPRFERLDFTSFPNVIMLHRLVKVFSQPGLFNKLYQAEKAFTGSTLAFESPRKHGTLLNHTRPASCDWADSYFHSDTYIPMFGPAIRLEIEQFIKTVHISCMFILREIQTIRRSQSDHLKSLGVFKKIFTTLFVDKSHEELKLQEISKIPDILDLAVRSLCEMFETELPNVSMEQIDVPDSSNVNQSFNFSIYDNSDYLDISRVSPRQMMVNLENMKPAIDPALLPIHTYEVKPLVRLLHYICCCVNDKYGLQLQSFWNRSDIVGKLTRQILYAPMTAQWFDKPKGVNELCEKEVPARLCLRILASYRSIALILLALVSGYIFWGSSTFGLIILFFTFSIYLFIRALMSS